jgi:DNA polymerase-3 subunit epsilon
MPERASPEISLLDVEVLIVDCQTTGATPAQGCVLELGWSVVRASDPAPTVAARAHWIALPEGQRVSGPVRQLTGFHEGVLREALGPEEAWHRLRATLPAGTPLPIPAAIHFARFELAFLRDWSRRFDGGDPLPIDPACVHAIACRLYPELPRRNLRALAGFLGHGLDLERRALGHVLATAFIWRKLVASLVEQHGIQSWSALARWLADPAARPTVGGPRRRAYPIASARYRQLPDAPGVYRLLRSNGDVLYVGKAKSLKKRLASHFGKQKGATERALEMLTQVSDVAIDVRATALEAALLETELIKRLDPPYNIQLVRGERATWFASGDLSSCAPAPDERHRLGPLPSRFSVRALRAVMELVGGESAGLARRAAAIGAPPSFAPDEATFAAGWALFVARRFAGRPCASGDARPFTMALARELLLLMRAGSELEERDLAASIDAEDDPALAPRWDPERVCRHLERALTGAYQVLRRSGWLCLLASSQVSFREPGDRSERVLRLCNAELTGSEEDRADAALRPPASRASRAMIQRAFDAARYDQLRILTSELKRIVRDGGDATVRIGRGTVLDGARLRQIFRLV